MIGTIETKGCTLAYKVEGTGEAAVFIQGVGLHGDGWLPQTETLKSTLRCITFDDRGMGKSQPAGGDITIAQLAADTVAVMDSLGIDKAHLVGHSLGGCVALQAALIAKQRVKSLALLCTSACGADATKLNARMIWQGLRTRVGTRRMRSNAFLEIAMPSQYLASQDREGLVKNLEPFFGHPLCETPAIVMRQLKALKQFDVTTRLSELGMVPTLVLSAAQDIIFPPSCGRSLQNGIPDARYIEIPDAAHGVTIQCAAKVNHLLHDHFDSARTI